MSLLGESPRRSRCRRDGSSAEENDGGQVLPRRLHEGNEPDEETGLDEEFNENDSRHGRSCQCYGCDGWNGPRQRCWAS
ncbi:UNVERIFIED_CONTAM: hypothetical protein GTU68_012398 [Idotea baltica]|nr:hypothetical protein [Idotea baltica]